MKWLSAFLIVTGVVGCGVMQVRTPHQTIGSGNTPYPLRGADARTVTHGGTSGLKASRFCRSSIPSGWIAVDYLPDSGCAATSSAASGHPVALAVQYSTLTTGAELEVC